VTHLPKQVDTLPEGTVYRLVDDRLRDMVETLTRFAGGREHGRSTEEE
jgi:hypothetical protein